MIMLRNREPLVSIVVPVYNVERYIDKCLDHYFRNLTKICNTFL